MQPRILIAAADPATWIKPRAALGLGFDVIVVQSAREALEKLSRQGPFSLMAADQRVAGLSGVDLLKAARQYAPETARILVARSEDGGAAIEAINVARVLAFLVEPYAPELLAGLVRETVTQQQRTRHEQCVVSQAAEGVVQMLTGLVHTRATAPEIPAIALQLRERVRSAAQALKLPTVADLEIAALLSEIALAAVPKHILDKLLVHEKLAEAEEGLLERMPHVGLRLVEHQPRFAGVAEIFRHQGTDPGPAVTGADGVREVRVPLASRILRAVVDLQLLEDAGFCLAAAFAELRKRSMRYDTTVVKSLELLLAGPNPCTNATFEENMVADLVVGCVLAIDVMSHEGVPLVSAGTTITPAVLDRLHNFAGLGEIVEPLYILRPAATEPATTAAAPAP